MGGMGATWYHRAIRTNLNSNSSNFRWKTNGRNSNQPRPPKTSTISKLWQIITSRCPSQSLLPAKMSSHSTESKIKSSNLSTARILKLIATLSTCSLRQLCPNSLVTPALRPTEIWAIMMAQIKCRSGSKIIWLIITRLAKTNFNKISSLITTLYKLIHLSNEMGYLRNRWLPATLGKDCRPNPPDRLNLLGK